MGNNLTDDEKRRRQIALSLEVGTPLPVAEEDRIRAERILSDGGDFDKAAAALDGNGAFTVEDITDMEITMATDPVRASVQGIDSRLIAAGLHTPSGTMRPVQEPFADAGNGRKMNEKEPRPKTVGGAVAHVVVNGSYAAVKAVLADVAARRDEETIILGETTYKGQKAIGISVLLTPNDVAALGRLNAEVRGAEMDKLELPRSPRRGTERRGSEPAPTA